MHGHMTGSTGRFGQHLQRRARVFMYIFTGVGPILQGGAMMSTELTLWRKPCFNFSVMDQNQEGVVWIFSDLPVVISALVS